MNTAISGSRTFTDEHLVRLVVARLLDQGDFVIIGDAPAGVDDFAYDYLQWCYTCHGRWRRYEAEWKKLGRAAGFLRNQRMIDDADRLIAVFAPGLLTPGTANAVLCAERKGIPIFRYHEGVWLSSSHAVSSDLSF